MDHRLTAHPGTSLWFPSYLVLFTISSVFTLFSVALSAQEGTVSITTEPQGISYRVDGQAFRGPSTFVWPKGSKHTLQVEVGTCLGQPTGFQYSTDCRVRFGGLSWSDNKGPLAHPGPEVPFTADPQITSLKLTAAVEYLVTIARAGTPADPNMKPVPLPNTPCVGVMHNPGAGGMACVGGDCSEFTIERWMGKGVAVELQAFPYAGFGFAGWQIGGGPNLLAPHSTYNVTGPTFIIPGFVAAKRLRILTEPTELKVLVDRQEVPTRDPANNLIDCPMWGHFDFLPESTHVFGALSPQMKDGAMWVFDSWSNGGSQNMIFNAGPASQTNIPETLIAEFIRGVNVRIALPRGLKAIVDGRDNWPNNQFVWGVGTRHVVTAPAEQFDANGRKYILKGWTNGGPATQEIIVPADAGNNMVEYKAEYEMQGMLVVQSSVRGPAVEVNGTACSTPCSMHMPMGTDIRVDAPAFIAVRDGERLEFMGWSDGRAVSERSVQLGSEPVLLSASYRSTYQLRALADPPNSATIRFEPAAADGYYPFNTRVQVFSTARPGYKFKGWLGDVSGSFSPISVTVGSPRSLIAAYEAVPHIAPAGVRNAVGETPQTGVAAGSIISIFGGILSSGIEHTPQQSRLSQRLAGTHVEVNGSVLPLFLVSPEQINAQLPTDLPGGVHTMRVINSAVSEPITAEFSVVQNAPGLFTADDSGVARALALNAQGTVVSTTNPLRPGEMVTLLGTGHGASRVPPPEGFGVKERPEYRLTDAVQVVVGQTAIEPEYAGAGQDTPGMIIVRFRLPQSAAHDEEVFVEVNGVRSNKAWLIIRPSGAQLSASVEEQE